MAGRLTIFAATIVRNNSRPIPINIRPDRKHTLMAEDAADRSVVNGE